MNEALQLPGISNAWTMPIKGRLDMLSTGIRTPVGIKISGADLGVIQKIALEVEASLQKVPGTRSVYAERVAGGYFLDFVLNRDKLARYGLSVDDANTDGHDRRRGRRPDHHGGGTRALRSQCPVRAGLPRGPRVTPARAAAASGRTGPDPHGRDRGGEDGRGARR